MPGGNLGEGPGLVTVSVGCVGWWVIGLLVAPLVTG